MELDWNKLLSTSRYDSEPPSSEKNAPRCFRSPFAALGAGAWRRRGFMSLLLTS